MNDFQDKPFLEVYPWYLVSALALGWGAIWFALWMLLRASVGGFVLYFSSLDAHWYTPMLVPVQAVIWIVALCHIQARIKQDRSPSPLSIILALVLLVTLSPSATYVIKEVSILNDFELGRSELAQLLSAILRKRVPNTLALIATLLVGACANALVMRIKYRAIAPQRKGLIVAVWLVAVGVGVAMAPWLGTMVGIMAMAAIGNIVAVHYHRETIRLHLVNGEIQNPT